MNKHSTQVWPRCAWLSAVCLTAIALSCLSAARADAASDSTAQPELVLQFGHDAEIERLAFSRDGQVLASGDQAGVVKLWDTTSGDLIRTLRGPDDVVALALSPDGAMLAIGGYGGVDLWDWRSGRHLRFLSTQHSRVVGLVWSSDGKTLVSADGTAQVWDVGSGQLIRTLRAAEYTGIESAVFSHDNTLLATSGGHGVHLWEMATGKMLRVISWEGVAALTFTSDNHTLVTSNGGDVRLWDVATGKLLRLPTGVTQPINGFALTDDGAVIARSAPNKQVKFWDIQSGRMLRAIPAEKILPFSSFPPRDKMLLSPDGRLLAQLPADQYGSLVVCDATTGAVRLASTGSWHGLTALTYSLDGKQLAAAQGAVQTWDMSAGRALRSLPLLGYGTYGMKTLSFASDNQTLYGITASGPDTSSLAIWNLNTGAVKGWPKQEGKMLTGLTISPDKKLLAGFDERAAIALFDLQTGQELYQLKGYRAEVPSLAFSLDSQLLAAPTMTGINLWDTKTGRLHSVLKTNANRYGEFVKVAFSPDGTLLGGRQHDSGDVLLWDVQSGAFLRALPGWGPTHAGFIFSPDGKSLAHGKTGHSTGIWDVQSGTLKLSLPDEGVMAFAPDGQTLAMSDVDGGVKLWDLKTGQWRATLIVLSDLRPTARQSSPISGVNPDWLIYTPAGFYDGSPSAAKFMRWQVAGHALPATSYAAYRQPDLAQQALRGNEHE